MRLSVENEGDSWSWQEHLFRWHFSVAKQADRLLNELERIILFSPCTIGYLCVGGGGQWTNKNYFLVKIYNKQTMEMLIPTPFNLFYKYFELWNCTLIF